VKLFSHASPEDLGVLEALPMHLLQVFDACIKGDVDGKNFSNVQVDTGTFVSHSLSFSLSGNSFKLDRSAIPVNLGQSLRDARGRVARKLRISVTDRCNFACLFCMPEKSSIKWIPKEEILSFEEILRAVRVLSRLGIERVRVTGGEPLLRPGLEALFSGLRDIEGIKDVDMTTNGWFLAQRAERLRSSGLMGVTVSLHSLRRERFTQISGIDALDRVLQGIEKALDVGLFPVKVNTVAIKGYNDDEVLDLVEYARERRISIRFIEFMPLDGLGKWSPERLLTGREIESLVSRRYKLVPQGRKKGDTANLWGFEDGKGELGLITPMSEPFCDDCDRIRLTADGKLLACLFDTRYNDLKPYLRGGMGDDELEKYILECVYRKPAGVAYMPWVRGSWDKPRAMFAIGG
jgi:cyclic pyranopterin phosphate synthase